MSPSSRTRRGWVWPVQSGNSETNIECVSGWLVSSTWNGPEQAMQDVASAWSSSGVPANQSPVVKSGRSGLASCADMYPSGCT